ncbi:DUF3558 domain-containing protein [Nocardia vaccinii]|uniref:DUF3558 domain-containing protein n=1 Tax=Nocardia vaccinii TaxID=1822 RepID=UPI001470F4AF|nr:DUF3558 domain-containing protein [Nocardia vaccinii]
MITLVAAAGLTLAGCGKSTSGSPTAGAQTTASESVAATSVSAASQWDPCTIPETTISGLGLDTTTKSNQISGTTIDGWKVCGWKSADKTYGFEIFTSGHSLDELKQRTDYTDFTPMAVDKRQALQYRAAGGNHDLDCSISAQIPGGTVDFEVLDNYGVSGTSDPCTHVRHLADGLAQYLPGA